MRLNVTTTSVHILVVNEQKGGLVKKGALLDEIICSSISGTDIKLMIEAVCVKDWAGEKSTRLQMSPRCESGILEENLGRRKDHAAGILIGTGQL
jgi:hypothetical protein